MILFRYFLLFTISIATTNAATSNFSDRLSLQGYTGLLNTPNALITHEKKIDLLYTNNFDNDFPDYTQSVDSYLFSIGIWPNIELGGRLVSLVNQESKFKGRRDLSGNIKWQFFSHKLWPSLAIGSQDFAGEARTSRSQYIVATKQLFNTRMSAGYGFNSNRLKGLFGGIEHQLTKGVYLLAEHDTVDTNYGIRITSDSWNLPFALSLTAKKSLKSKQNSFYYGIGISMPLTGSTQSNNTAPIKLSPPQKMKPKTPSTASNTQRKLSNIQKNHNPSNLNDLHQTLNHLGLEKVQIGINHQKKQLFVEYENHRYNHNEMDALGIALGVAAMKAPDNITSLTVLSRKHGIAILEVHTQITHYKQFLTALESTKYPALKINYPVTPYHYDGIDFIHSTPNKKSLRSELFLYPKTSIFVGTELGVIDSSIALQADWYLPLWKGATFNIAYQKEFYHTSDFNEGRPFGRFKIQDGLSNILFHQAFKPHKNITSLISIGQYEQNYLALFNDTIAHITNTPFRVRTRVGYYDHKKIVDNRFIAVGSIRYLYAPKDVLMEASFGQFWFDDRAVLIEAARYFGDTKITLFYKENDESAAGLKVSLPLTPRKDMRPSMLQVKGANRWTYGLQTSIARGVNKTSNALDTKIAVMPSVFHNTENVYQNQGRLNPAYIQNNLLRLRNAYYLLAH